jgi:hypothetical protein
MKLYLLLALTGFLVISCGNRDDINDGQHNEYSSRFGVNNEMGVKIQRVVEALPCQSGARFELNFRLQGTGASQPQNQNVYAQPLTFVRAGLGGGVENITFQAVNYYIAKSVDNSLMVYKDRGGNNVEMTLSLCRDYYFMNNQVNNVQTVEVYNLIKNVSRYCTINEVTAANVLFSNIQVLQGVPLTRGFFPIDLGATLPTDICPQTRASGYGWN